MRNYFSVLCFFLVFLANHQIQAQAVDSSEFYFQKQKWEKDILNLKTKIKDFNINVENEQEYTKLLKQLGYLFLNTGNFKDAEENLLKSYTIIEESHSKDFKYYIDEIDGIAQFYKSINNLSEADYYAQKGYDLTLNSNFNKEYLNFLSLKASIKYDLGDIESAYILYLECISLAKELYGSDSNFYSILMGNMGDIMIKRNDFDNAKRCYLINYLNTYTLYGDNDIQTALVLNKLSNIYVKLNDYQKALELNLRAHQIITQLTGENSSNYGISCYNLACTYALFNDLKNAEKYYLESYKINTGIYGSENTNSLSCLKSILILYNKIGTLNYNTDFLSKYFVLIDHKMEELAYNFSQKELILFSKTIAVKNFTPNSFLHSYPSQFPEINIGCFGNELLLKNLSLRNQQRIKNSIEKSNDAVLKEKYQQFVANKRYLTKLEELPLAQRPLDFESIKTETENLEKDITRQSATFADAKKMLSISWKQIQEKLLPNDVVIDVVSYHYYNKKWTDSIMYGAFVIKKDSKFPKYINLFEEKQLAALLERNIVAADTIQAKILNKQYSDKSISDLFLKPLEKELNGSKTIYLSPSGLGHQINFKALPISENQTLGEQFNIKLVGSSASIVDYKTTAFQENKSLEIILYGGIDYAKSSVTTPNEENKEALRSNSEGGFGYLKGTLAEINSIANQVKTNKNTAILKTERNATEESIKQLDGKIKPFVLHLATHGYFFPDPKQELPKEDLLSDSKFKMYKTADDPMMRSGLLFAGANKYWGKPIENLTTDDGILTASEISNLDLSSCQLVVMSACETGLGQINGSEGVFGLQRAFKMAGVKNIIMSLWKVPDAQTAELFDIFYNECFSGKTIPEAFQTAQAKMKAKYSPYFWAGFVLLE